jgi:hypothetical protein
MTAITIQEFKTQFDRNEFTYGDETPNVRDKDIQDAMNNALSLFNQGLYPIPSTEYPTDVGKQALLYLTAHELKKMMNEVADQGQSQFNQNSRSVGSISESLSIPEWMNESVYAYFTTTSFGIRYVLLTMPYLGGTVYTISGATQP